MSAAVPSIITHLIALLEGREGSDRTIPTGRFEHIGEVPLESLGAQRLAARPRPVEIVEEDFDDDEDHPVNLAGDHVYGACRLRLRIGYAARKQRVAELRAEIAEDRYQLRRCLLWAANRWSGATGVEAWHGTRLLNGGAVRILESGDAEEALAFELPLIVSFREDHTT